jgi:hypothetical protein
MTRLSLLDDGSSAPARRAASTSRTEPADAPNATTGSVMEGRSGPAARRSSKARLPCSEDPPGVGEEEVVLRMVQAVGGTIVCTVAGLPEVPSIVARGRGARQPALRLAVVPLWLTTMWHARFLPTSAVFMRRFAQILNAKSQRLAWRGDGHEPIMTLATPACLEEIP